MSTVVSSAPVLVSREDHPSQIARVVLGIDGMYSTACARRIERALDRMPSVKADASYASGTLRIQFDRTLCPLPEIVARLDRIGYRVRFDPALARKYAPAVPKPMDRIAATLDGVAQRFARLNKWVSEHQEITVVALAGILLFGGAAVHFLDGPQWARVTLLVLSAVLSSSETGKEALATLSKYRLDVDVLMFVAAIGAATLGHFEEGALLLFLFGLGSAGEHLALGRATSAISALAKIAPETALRFNITGETEPVPVAQLAVEDRILVRPFDRVAADGKVIEGASSVDQAAITGESLPVEKSIGAPVFAGTMNGEGRLVVRVTRLATETTLSKIIRLVEEAQATKSPTQQFTDKVEHWYVPFVFVATAALIVLPPIFSGQWGMWFYRSMAFLTAASPCALAIGTPAAVLCGIARSAREGVLIKGGAYLESLGAVRVVAFDKTVTLTTGELAVTDVVPLNGTSDRELLALAAAVESSSSHPLAAAITRHATTIGPLTLTAADVEQRPGLGAIGRVDGCKIAVGKRCLIDDDDANDETAQRIEQLASQGKAIVAVGRDSEVIGLLALSDQPRANAKDVVAQLHAQGVHRTFMLTGDHQQAANSIAQRVGVDQTYAGLLPEDKLQILQTIERDHGPVAMVGDGVNDAPALAQASVGIAMGAAGTDVAIETADVVLMSSDLEKLPRAIAISRFSRRIIAQNLLIALGVICVVAPLSALGFTKLSLAVLLHEGSTVVVVCNALRILGIKPAATRS